MPGDLSAEFKLKRKLRATFAVSKPSRRSAI